MKKKVVKLNFGSFEKNIEVNLVPFWFDGIGLMFKGKRYSKNLLFSFGNNVREPIHSFFVFHNFYAIWCDEKYNVLDFRMVSPWKLFVNCRREYRYLIEIPFENLGILSRRELDDVLERFK